MTPGRHIAFVGDVHGQIDQMYLKLDEWQDRTGKPIDAVVQVGDFGVFPKDTDFAKYWNKFTPAPIPTWVIMGNHEDPDLIRTWQAKPGRMPGFHLIPDGEIVDVLGVQVGGVWGNFSPKSWADPERVAHHRLTGASPRIAMHVDRRAVERLIAAPGPMNVFVTHDASRLHLPWRFRRTLDPITKGILGLESNEESGGCAGFDEILAKHRPAHYFFGHLHFYTTGQMEWTDSQLQLTAVAGLNALFYEGGPWFRVEEFV